MRRNKKNNMKKTGRNRMKWEEMGRNKKKREETSRNRKNREETRKNGKKQEETGRNRKKVPGKSPKSPHKNLKISYKGFRKSLQSP